MGNSEPTGSESGSYTTTHREHANKPLPRTLSHVLCVQGGVEPIFSKKLTVKHHMIAAGVVAMERKIGDARLQETTHPQKVPEQCSPKLAPRNCGLPSLFALA